MTRIALDPALLIHGVSSGTHDSLGVGRTMRSHGFIEIDGGADGPPVGRLLEAAYGASRRHRIFVWLRRMDWSSVDAILDPVVAHIGLEVTGLEFLAEGDRERAVDLAARATFCVVTSQYAADLMATRSIHYLRSDDGLTLLRSAGRQELPEAQPQSTFRHQSVSRRQ